jgi:nucleoside-diphosphate-sugar epimerase
MPHSQADIGEARRLLGFEPVVSLDEGIRRTVAWFQAQRAGVARAS